MIVFIEDLVIEREVEITMRETFRYSRLKLEGDFKLQKEVFAIPSTGGLKQINLLLKN